MQNITIKIQKFNSDTEIQTVDAKKIYEYVESKQQYADWIKNRLDGFEQNIDFVCYSENYETQRQDGQRGVATKKAQQTITFN